MPVLGTRGDALGEGAAPFRGEMPPLMLVNSAKRVVPDAHDGEVSSVCVDGDHCVTAGWDGQLRFWAKYDALPTRSFQLVQRAQALEDAVKTVATIADKWVISAGLNGLCRVWTRSGEAAMHPSQIPEPTPNEKPGDEKPNGEDRAPPPPKHPLPLDDLGDDNAEEVGLEMEELRLARTERKRVLAQYDGPWKCVGAFDGGAGGCVNAVVGLHAPEDAGCVAKPPAIALMKRGPHLGSMTHAVRILDPTRNWATIQVLEHPEGVTRLLRKVGCELDGSDRLVTGCLDGRIRVYARDLAEPDPRPPPWSRLGRRRRSVGRGCRCRDGEGGDEGERNRRRRPEASPSRARAVVPSVPTRGDAARASHRRRHPIARRARIPPRSPRAPRAPAEGGRPSGGRRRGHEPVEPRAHQGWPGCDSTCGSSPSAPTGREALGATTGAHEAVGASPLGIRTAAGAAEGRGEGVRVVSNARSGWQDHETPPLAPRIRIANDESSKIESLLKARLTCVRVWREHVTVGLGDGRMCTWGRRVRDESGVEE